RPRADPQPKAAGAVRPPVAPDRRRAARAVGMALGAEHDRRLGRDRDLPARGAVRSRRPLRPARAAPLLDGDLAAARPEHGARTASRAARAGAQGAQTRLSQTRAPPNVCGGPKRDPSPARIAGSPRNERLAYTPVTCS